MNKEDLFFVKRLFELAKKLNKTIKVASKDDAANLYAYLKGYTSWAEMLMYEKTNNLLNEESLSNIKEKIFNDKNWQFSNDFYKNLEKDDGFVFEKNISEKTNILDNYKIGNIEMMKSFQPALLETQQNALIYSDINHVAQRIFRDEVKEIFTWNKSAIICGINNKISDTELNSFLEDKKYVSLGRKEAKEKLNPMLDLFTNDAFEDFFGIIQNEEFIFQDIWLNLIRIYKEQLNYKITPKFLKDSLKIENLIQLMTNVEKNIQLQIKPLINYINKYLDVVYLKEKQTFVISAEAQEKHYKQTKLLQDKVKKLNELYDVGVFDLNGTKSIFDFLNTKSPILIYDIEENNLKKCYWDIIFQLLDNVYVECNSFVEKSMVSTKRYATPLLVWGSDNILTPLSIKIIIKHEQFFKTHLYDLDPQNRNIVLDNIRNVFSNKITQILFLRQNLTLMNKDLEDKIKNQTVNWNMNIFYSNYNKLRNLTDYEAILWQKDRMENTLSGLEDFVLNKVMLNNPENNL